MEQTISNQEVTEKELHPQATELAKKYVRDFASSLLFQAKAIATNKKADVVLSSHVEEALKTIQKQQEDSWINEVCKIIGSALFGAFVQGFVTELEAGNTPLIVTYTIMGFVGVFLIFYGFRR